MGDFDIERAKYNERQIFSIWRDRFVNEYNRSRQARTDRKLVSGTPQDHWDLWFDNNVVPMWIKLDKRNIGFICPQSLTLVHNDGPIQKLEIVSDVYVDPKFRGRGILAQCLLNQRENGRMAILIDELKLRENAAYYVNLGFRYFTRWTDQELLIVSPQKLLNDKFWRNLVPEDHV